MKKIVLALSTALLLISSSIDAQEKNALELG